MLENDVIIAKISIIKNCKKSIERVLRGEESNLDDFIVQDVFVLNLQRAVQACIDIANNIIVKENLGVPRSYGNAFELIAKAGFIDLELLNRMKKMVGFRNIAVHEYQEIDVSVLKSIYKNNLVDFDQFVEQVIKKADLSKPDSN